MRLCSLGLVRFGPFADVALDFGATPGRVEIVYGANEAGKSTALRAISGLLFGIPRATRDGHTFPMQELRVRGRLLAADGRSLEIERLKRDKTSLFDWEGRPLDAKVLDAWLDGVGESVFNRTFGLDQTHLRAGAEALLDGAGDVGESLFDAALGGQSVHRVLAELEREAEAHFNPSSRAEKPHVNKAVKALREANKKLGLVVVAPDAWLKQRENLASVSAELERLDERRRELTSEQQRLVLVREAAPLILDRTRILAELTALGPVSMLPADARARRLDAEREEAFLVREITRLDARIAELRDKRHALDVPSELADFDATSAEELRDRLGSQKKAARDLPKRQAQLKTLEADAAALVRGRLGRSESHAIRALELDAAARARIKKLERDHGALVAEENAERRALAEADEKLQELQAELADVAPESDFSALESAVNAAARAGDLEADLARVEREIRNAEGGISAALNRIGLGEVTPAELVKAEAPSLETIERFEAEFAKLDSAGAALERERVETDRRLADAEQDLDALKRAGDVPSETDLGAARARRESAWQRVRAARHDEREFAAEAGKHEHLVREADDVADRLRREEARVRKRAERESERERALAALTRLDADDERIDIERNRSMTDWKRAFAPLGIEPRSPAEMRGWHARFSATVAEIERVTRLGSEADETRRDIERQRSALSTALGADADRGTLGDLFDRARTQLEQLRRSSIEREARERALTKAQAVCERSRKRLDQRSADREKWNEAWTRALTPLGLSADATPEEVSAVIDAVDQLAQKLQEAEHVRGRIEGIERDTKELDALVESWVKRHAPDLSGRPAVEAAQALLARYDEAASNIKLSAAHEEDIEASERARDEARERLARCQAELAVLMREAGVTTLDELRVAEERSERAAHMKSELERIEARLAEAREGRSLETIEAEIAGIDVRAARSRLEEIESEREALEEERHAQRQKARDLEVWLEQASSSTAAIEAEAEIQHHAADARAGLQRWARLTVASRLLRREIERYRERHQGPVLERATRLFSTLSAGRYGALRSEIDSDDKPVLRCVRADDVRVDIAGLSEATRDQLYLALRIATLEHYATDHEPLPFVLDDVLMTFDDDRVRAALAVLADAARHMQVLIFTHQASVVTLARETLGAERLSVHELQRVEPARPSRPERRITS